VRRRPSLLLRELFYFGVADRTPPFDVGARMAEAAAAAAVPGATLRGSERLTSRGQIGDAAADRRHRRPFLRRRARYDKRC